MLVRFALVSSVALCAAAIIAAPRASAQEVTLSALNYLPNTVDFGQSFFDWVEEVNREGKGVVQIAIRSSGSMGPANMGDAVKSGVVDMANVPPAFYQKYVPVADGIKLATISHAEMHKNGAEDFINKLHNEKMGVEYLTTYGWGTTFHLYLRDKEIRQPEDIKGLKIRVSPVYRAFFNALQAETVQMPSADLYTALERGVVDGYGWSNWSIRGNGWEKVTKFRVDPGFFTPNNAIIVNHAKWKALTQQQRDFLKRKAIELASDFETKSAKPLNEKYNKELGDAGIKVITFTGATRERYLKTAYDTAWQEMEKLDPVNAPKLKALITR